MPRPPLIVVLIACSTFLLQASAQQPFRLGGAPVASDPATPPAEVETPDAPAVTLPEFPPGLFSDWAQYRLNDLAGKTIVLFFFDPTDERAAATLSQRNAVVRHFRDKPVAFFGVQAGSIAAVRATVRQSNLEMPVFADTLGVLAARYNAVLSATRSWHVVIIAPGGEITHEEMTVANIDKTLPAARWRYRQSAYDPRLTPALNAFESGQFDRGGRLLAAVLDCTDRRATASAQLLRDVLEAQAAQWKADADRLRATDALAAYDLYARVAAALPGTATTRAVADPMKRLEAVRTVADELAARGMYDVLCAAIAGDDQIRRTDAAAYCRHIIQAYPATPTAERLVKYLEDLGRAHTGNGPPRRRA